MKIQRLSKLALFVNLSSLLVGAILSLVFFFTPLKDRIFSYILGVLAGLCSFTIMIQNGKNMIRQSERLKEGQKPVNYFFLYLIVRLIFTFAFLFVVSYFQFVEKKEGYDILIALFGYLTVEACMIITALVLREKVIY